MSANNNRQFLASQIIWIGLSFGLSLAICMLVPFPISIVVIVGLFILFSFCMGRRMMKIMGIGGSDDGILKYYCMSCGTAHREPACPKCGSRMKRVGS